MRITGTPGSSTKFDIELHGRVAADEYRKIRPLYEVFSHVIHDILENSLSDLNIKVASVQQRAKTVESFAKKASEPSATDPNSPRYTSPLSQITDLAGARVITFFPSTVVEVEKLIADQFIVLKRLDKAETLKAEERFGYQSIHYLVTLKEDRTGLPEYHRFADLVVEIQLRTILQHTWAEIEHDIQYKSVESIPLPIRRKFMQLAASLELMDGQVQAIHDEDERFRQQLGDTANPN